MASKHVGSQLLMLLAILGLLFKGSCAISCVQCKTHPATGPLGLTERIKCTYGLLDPQKCPGNAVACLTYVGKMAKPGEDVVVRDCADMMMQPFCSVMPGMPGSTETHEICINTCKQSKCSAFTSDMSRRRRWYY